MPRLQPRGELPWCHIYGYSTLALYFWLCWGYHELPHLPNELHRFACLRGDLHFSHKPALRLFWSQAIPWFSSALIAHTTFQNSYTDDQNLTKFKLLVGNILIFVNAISNSIDNIELTRGWGLTSFRSRYLGLDLFPSKINFSVKPLSFVLQKYV